MSRISIVFVMRRAPAAGAGLILFVLGTAAAYAQSGTVERINVFGPSLEGNLIGSPDAPDVSIYLPPSYAEDADRRYPVVYLLHGYTGTDETWTSENGLFGAIETSDRIMGSGASSEMILVMPNCNNEFNGCMYVNSAATGYWEDYIADDLVDYIDSHYRTIADREARGLAGHSMGGYGVMLIGMRRPDVFSSIYSMSACCLDEYTPLGLERMAELESIETREQLAQNRGALRTFAVTAAWSPNPDKPPFFMDLPTENGEILPEVVARHAANSPHAMLPSHVGALKKMTAIMIDVGEQDGLIGANRELSEMMTAYGVEHTFETYEGNHVSGVGQRFEENVLPFFGEHLRQR